VKQRRNRSKAGRKLARIEPVTPLSAGRKWLFRFFALVVIPLLLLGTVEIVLRLVGYGYSTGFFEKVRVGEKEFLVSNENFSLRFFPLQLVRQPEPVKMEARKPANTYRIFILGESAAMGDPKPAYGAGRYLDTLLSERFPKTHFEVVNLGITAINSHVILPIARDCAQADGDLWIIYMGNNEMVGPFGAATVFGQKAPPLGFVRLNLAIQKTRIGQLLADIGRRSKGKNDNSSWGGMNMFAGNQLRADDPRKEVVYQNFERNLNDIVRAGMGSDAKILLNTAAVNLKDCPPFASLANSNLPAADRAQFDKLFSAACADETQANFAGAAQKFKQAAILDPQFSELQFRWAECLLALTNFADARQHFQTACDVDALQFRADSKINSAIQKIGRKFAGDKLTFFDAAAVLAAEVSNGICGQETFYEHVHFNFDGNFRLGRAWAEQVEKMLPPAILHDVGTNGWASQDTCDRLLGLTDWNRCAVTQLMIDRVHRPPLSDQSNNSERMQLLRDEAKELRQRMKPTTAQQAAEIYLAAIKRAPQDHFLHENFAEFLESVGDLKLAVAQWQQVQEILPQYWEPFFQTGRLFAELEQWDTAEAAFTKVVNLNPRLAEGWNDLGCAHFATRKFASALLDYNQARQLAPLDATYCACAGKTLSKLGRHTEAVQLYYQAIQLQPDLWEAHFALADELATMGQIAEAAKEYAEAVRIVPANALAHLNWGIMQAKLGQFNEALAQFNKTLQLDPDNRQAREYIDQMQHRKNSGR
jgi:tetratricopeptide (TPR) repeat protein